MAGVKEHYLDFVQSAFPWLYGRYVRAYPAVHAPPDYRERLAERVGRIRLRYGFEGDEMRARRRPRPAAPTPTQLALGL